MKPEVSSNQTDCKSKEPKSSAQILCENAPIYPKFVVVLSFESVQEEKRILDSFIYALGLFFDSNNDHNDYTTDQNHVYVIALDGNDGLRDGDIKRRITALNDVLNRYLEEGSIHITIYCGTEIYINTNREINSTGSVLDIIVTKGLQLSTDFINVIKEDYPLSIQSSPIMVNDKVLHVV